MLKIQTAAFGVFHIEDGDGKRVCVLESVKDPHVNLFLAAPDLLAACEGILASFAECVKTTEALEEFPALKAVQDAVNKAKKKTIF